MKDKKFPNVLTVKIVMLERLRKKFFSKIIFKTFNFLISSIGKGYDSGLIQGIMKSDHSCGSDKELNVLDLIFNKI